MTYRDGGKIHLVTDGPLTLREWRMLRDYVLEVLKPLPDPKECSGEHGVGKCPFHEAAGQSK